MEHAKQDFSVASQSQEKEEELVDLDLNKEPFYFESDSLALRNNSDYSCLLKTFILLEGQRIQAIQDLEKLIDLKEQAMREPVKFIDQLLKSSSIQADIMKNLNPTNAQEVNLVAEMPSRQKIFCLPDINWNKYYDCVDIEDLEAIKNQNNKHNLRESNKSTRNSTRIQINQVQQLDQHPADPNRTKQRRSTCEIEKTPANYNKSWSVDEQRRLEELLIEFPPEDNEAARWRKIANKLGTRTPLQVQSHCQKYFIKLAKAGLPIPGRMPNLKTYVVRKGNRGNRRSSLMRGACMSVGHTSSTSAAGIGGGRLNRSGVTSRRMVGRGSSLNEISSMWSSFNPPITMNDEQNEDEDETDEADQSQYEETDYFYEDQEEEDEENNNFDDCDQESQEQT
jgi:hypothetical protein